MADRTDDTPPPRHDLADRIMSEVRARARPKRRRRYAPLAAALALAAAFALSLAWFRPATPPGEAPPAGVLVHFSLDVPGGARVALAGDFNGWAPQPLERAPDGTFTTRLALPAGEWRYQLVVDGAWVDDPHATAYRPDGFGGRNAILKLD